MEKFTEKFPETLFVAVRHVLYPGCGTQLVATEDIEQNVYDDKKEHKVAQYKLVCVDTYKKITTTTVKLEKVGQ